jgi:hypothetical protein
MVLVTGFTAMALGEDPTVTVAVTICAWAVDPAIAA